MPETHTWEDFYQLFDRADHKQKAQYFDIVSDRNIPNDANEHYLALSSLIEPEKSLAARKLVPDEVEWVKLNRFGREILPRTDYRGLDMHGYGKSLRDSLNPSADFTGSNFEGMDLKRVVFTNAKLANANLQRANLRNADFHNADLSGANLQDADLRGAKFTGADLVNAYMNGARVNENTSFSNAILFMPDFSDAYMKPDNIIKEWKFDNSGESRFLTKGGFAFTDMKDIDSRIDMAKKNRGPTIPVKAYTERTKARKRRLKALRRELFDESPKDKQFSTRRSKP